MEFDWDELVTSTLPMRVSWDPVFQGRAEVVAYGTVVDDWHGEWWVVGDDTVGFCSDPGGVIVGFQVELSEWDPHGPTDPDVWDGPRFWVPTLGLREATAGEILLACQARWGQDASSEAYLFQAAAGAKEESLERALELWRQLADMGDLRGVYGMGYTLLDLDRPAQAYAHLRHYSELCPANAWAWCYLGRALEAVGEDEEAAVAYDHAIALEAERGMETDAPELRRRLG